MNEYGPTLIYQVATIDNRYIYEVKADDYHVNSYDFLEFTKESEVVASFNLNHLIGFQVLEEENEDIT